MTSTEGDPPGTRFTEEYAERNLYRGGEQLHPPARDCDLYQGGLPGEPQTPTTTHKIDILICIFNSKSI